MNEDDGARILGAERRIGGVDLRQDRGHRKVEVVVEVLEPDDERPNVRRRTDADLPTQLPARLLRIGARVELGIGLTLRLDRALLR